MLFAVTSKLSGFEDDGKEPADVPGFMRVAPALLLAVLVSAATQTSTYSLLPVFGAGYGLAEATLAALITALSIGNIALQIPLGVAAERFGARTMIVVLCRCHGPAGAAAARLHPDADDMADPDRARRGRLRHLHDGADRARQPLLAVPC